MATKKQKEYSAAIQAICETVRRTASAHAIPIDQIIRDMEIAMCEDENYTHEQYLGVYATHTPLTQPRATIPACVPVALSWHVYLNQWNELRYCPISEAQRKRGSPVQVAS